MLSWHNLHTCFLWTEVFTTHFPSLYGKESTLHISPQKWLNLLSRLLVWKFLNKLIWICESCEPAEWHASVYILDSVPCQAPAASLWEWVSRQGREDQIGWGSIWRERDRSSWRMSILYCSCVPCDGCHDNAAAKLVMWGFVFVFFPCLAGVQRLQLSFISFIPSSTVWSIIFII